MYVVSVQSKAHASHDDSPDVAILEIIIIIIVVALVTEKGDDG